jgi:hypothetical protein
MEPRAADTQQPVRAKMSGLNSIRHVDDTDAVSSDHMVDPGIVDGTELEFVIMVIAVSCVKLLSAHNSTQHTSRKHKV